MKKPPEGGFSHSKSGCVQGFGLAAPVAALALSNAEEALDEGAMAPDASGIAGDAGGVVGAAGAIVAGGGVTTAGAGSSFLPQAVNAAAAMREASKSDLFIGVAPRGMGDLYF